MKIYKPLLGALAVVAAILTGCSSDDDLEITDPSTIIQGDDDTSDDENSDDANNDGANNGDETDLTVSISGAVITITNPSVTASSLSTTYSFSDAGLSDLASLDNYTFTVSDGTTITFAKNEGSLNPTYYTIGTTVIMYELNSMTVTGCRTIASIAVNCSSSYYIGNTDYLEATIDGNAITLVNGWTSDLGGTQINAVSITITYAESSDTYLAVSAQNLSVVSPGGDVTFDITSNTDWSVTSSDPTNFSVSPASGNGNDTVTVTCAKNTGSERSATITVTASTLSTTVTVSQDAYVHISGSGTADDPYTVAEACAILAAGEATSNSVYVKGIVSEIWLVDLTYQDVSYYISDDGQVTPEQFLVDMGKGLNGASITSETDVQVGDVVVVCGVLTTYNWTYPYGFAAKSSIYSLTRDTSGDN